MNTETIFEIDCSNFAATRALGLSVAKNLQGGEVIELIGDLGAGKTAFIKALVAGAGSHDDVSSPSFTIMNQYKAGKVNFYHYDFYRLGEAGILKEELSEALSDPLGVVCVEWGEIVDEVLPKNRMRINIAVTGENSRRFNFSFNRELEYMLRGVK